MHAETLVAMARKALLNSWYIVGMLADEGTGYGAVVMIKRAGDFADDVAYGTAIYNAQGNYFVSGHYDMSHNEARADMIQRAG